MGLVNTKVKRLTSATRHSSSDSSFSGCKQYMAYLGYLPPYSPKLNRIEELWGSMKSSVINNVFFDSVHKIRKAVQDFIRLINETPAITIERLCLQF